MWGVAVCHIVSQCDAIRCSVLQCVEPIKSRIPRPAELAAETRISKSLFFGSANNVTPASLTVMVPWVSVFTSACFSVSYPRWGSFADSYGTFSDTYGTFADSYASFFGNANNIVSVSLNVIVD